VTCLFIARPQFLLLCALLSGFLVGCSKQGERTPSTDVPLANHARNEEARKANGEARVTNQPELGFQDYVKNPDLFRQETREKAVKDSAPPTPRELADLVSAMGRRRLGHEELQKLKRAGNQVVPLLQTALRDEKFLFHRYGESVLGGSAIETALGLLEPFGLPAANLLEPALRHPDEVIRYRALFHLARCGNDDAIAALTAGLNAPSEQCRTWTLMGLEYLKDTPRGSAKFRAALFEAAIPLLADKAFTPAEHAPRALLALDFDRAKRVLLGADVFHPENKSIARILQALMDAKVPVPGPQLRNLLAGIKKKATGFPYDFAYADGLILLARTEASGARDLIRDAQGWGNDKVKEGAAKALAIAVGITDAYGFVSELYQRKGAKGLTEPQLYYLTLCWLDGDVRNGGFTQYYFNSSGELAPYAVKAAKAVGASQLAAIIQKANALFGKDGPDPDRDKRMDQLSKIDLKTLDDLATQYYNCTEQLREILPRFVAANPEAFKPAP
jgi:hypothetical protein